MAVWVDSLFESAGGGDEFGQLIPKCNHQIVPGQVDRSVEDGESTVGLIRRTMNTESKATPAKVPKMALWGQI